jgi:hypothetical protein
MAFSRPNYDDSVYNLQIKRSTEGGDYRLNPDYAENINPCYMEQGIIGAKSDVSLVREQINLSNESMVDVENELSWRCKPLSKSNNNNSPFEKFKLIHKNNCGNCLPEDTRFTHPIDNYRSMSLLNYEITPYVHVNPQCYIQSINDKIGLNSRLYIKDNHRYPNQNSWDNGDSLPKENPSLNINQRCKYTCDTFIS